MSVLKGEGSHPIMFGSTSIAVGSLTHGGYLARPNGTGEWPTILLVPSEWGITSSVKDVARRLARYGFAVAAVNYYGDTPPSRDADPIDAANAARAVPEAAAAADLDDFADYVANPAGFWSNAEDGFGVLAFGEGGRFAVQFVARNPGVPLALVGTRLEPPQPGHDEDAPAEPLDYPNAVIARVSAPILGASGRDDPSLPLDDVMELRRQAPHCEWVLYDGVGSQFTDDYLDGYDGEAAADLLDRLIDFFAKHLPPHR
jgi:carboxymethylenebutenolidase